MLNLFVGQSKEWLVARRNYLQTVLASGAAKTLQATPLPPAIGDIFAQYMGNAGNGAYGTALQVNPQTYQPITFPGSNAGGIGTGSGPVGPTSSIGTSGAGSGGAGDRTRSAAASSRTNRV